ncbi:MAG: fatty acid desaturase [Thiohalocapsa sp.]|jgi:stearoyl-CoA desaturase (delta-9 desaturase)|uniref:DesA family fatty acid desaturase n=1 Tax=Thiohalocapsa sp. TaxID=2497641 RepID=UPI0025D94116|nr:fatty acid desaturase [Thiohalocapsa sp.]MCG6941886.1 fatty acid desaturase [Thiohalocapsa sp.]
MTYQGLLGLGPWQVVLATLAMTHLTIVSVTLYLHRAQAHRALRLHPAVAHLFRLWLWLTTGMVTRQWVAVHRKHHAHCETARDPHSPQVLGIGAVLWRGAELYAAAAKNADDVYRYGHGAPDDWLERNLYSRFSWHGLGVMLVLDLLLFGVYGLTVWAVQMLWIPLWAAGVINGIGHYWGYRNFETPDASTNIVPWGVLIGGEELHNNHHAFPSSARLSMRRWEFDLGWAYIRLLGWLGLAKVKRIAPAPRFIEGKRTVDIDTLTALLVGRMHVIRRFSLDVLKPVTREALCTNGHRCRMSARRAARMLARTWNQLDETGRRNLENLLAQSRELQVVYQFREQLRQIWERNAPSQEVLLRQLQDWCRQAEATGIQALEGFSRQLRGMALTGSPAVAR